MKLLPILLTLPLFAGQMDLMVPMRDGVKLHTLVFTPEGDGPWPTVLTRTPYEMQRGSDAKAYVGRGYVRVIQNVRGQFQSEGKYRAFTDDVNDGYDTVEWIAKQKWCTGKVGVTGGSAGGITTNMAAISGAPHLTAAYVTVATGSTFRHAAYPGGVFLQHMNEQWMKGRGVEPSTDPRPLHRVYDDEARQTDMRQYYSKISVPFVNVGGWYDIFSAGTVENFIGLQAHGAAKARGNQKLVMGAFGHGAMSGDVKYPADAADRRLMDPFRWFDYWLKGEQNGADKDPAVRYYMMGDTFDKSAPGNEWRSAASWPPASAITSYYLHAGGGLTTSAPRAAKDTFTYDPRNPVPTIGGNNLTLPKGPMDQRPAGTRSDVLRYQTEPLPQAVEIAGNVEAELTVSTDAEDTDFMVKLVDVYPNGYEALVLDQAYRLRYHAGFDKATFVEKNKPYTIKVSLWPTALVFNKGHRIAVHVSSSNAPRFERHTNTWAPLTSYDQAVVARNTVHIGKSRLLLPVTKVYPAAATSRSGSQAKRF